MPGPRRRRGRRYAAVAASALILAGLVAGLISIAGDRNGETGTPPLGSGGTVAPSGDGRGSTSGQTPSPRPPIPLPAGWRTYRDASGFTVGVPAAWRVTTSRTGATFTDPTSNRQIRIDRVPNAGMDPHDYWMARSVEVGERTVGYDFSRIARVMYRGWPTGDFEYYGGPARARTHMLYRYVAPGGPTAYTIFWSTADSRWKADHKYFDTVVGTFALDQ